MNYYIIITKCLTLKTYRELDTYLNEIFKDYTFVEDADVLNDLKKRIWEVVNENNLADEVTDFVGFNVEETEAEFGFVRILQNPQDVYAAMLHWIHCRLKQF